MARPAKKKSTAKKAAKKPAAAPSSKTSSKKPSPKAAGPKPVRAEEQAAVTPYAPKPIEGIGWPAFRYPLP
jgi:hypothetical protein